MWEKGKLGERERGVHVVCRKNLGEKEQRAWSSVDPVWLDRHKKRDSIGMKF